jgi:DNA-binding NtrC family response regulator
MSVASLSEGATVLVVEQEPRMRAAVARILDQSGFMVVHADSAQDALATLAERSDVRVVVTDIDLADAVDGLAFTHEVHHRWPALGQVITSGQVRHLHPSEVPGDGIFMPHPLPIQAFLDAISLAACHGR